MRKMQCNQKRWSRGHKVRGQRHKKIPRPRTALPRTNLFEAKDRNARGQGQGLRTQRGRDLKKRCSKFFLGDLQNSNNSKNTDVLEPRTGHFLGLEASRPRTSKCVLENVLEAKDVLEDSTSDNQSVHALSLLLANTNIDAKSCD